MDTDYSDDAGPTIKEFEQAFLDPESIPSGTYISVPTLFGRRICLLNSYHGLETTDQHRFSAYLNALDDNLEDLLVHDQHVGDAHLGQVMGYVLPEGKYFCSPICSRRASVTG